MAAQPDLIVLGGDYVTWGDRQYRRTVGRSARARCPRRTASSRILGNHDDDHDMPAALAARGVAGAEGRAGPRLTIRNETLELAGIRFWTKRAGRHRRGRRAARRAPVILLAHDPRRLTEAAALDDSAGAVGPHARRPGRAARSSAPSRRRNFRSSPASPATDDTTIFVSRGVGTVYVPVESTARRKSPS